MIKYLNQKEKIFTKPLYKEAFFEDSDSFVNYYYEEKLKDNRILVDIEGESIRSMIMLNPYKISVFNKIYNLDYIVAVATGKEFKRQGYMRRLLNKALCDMNAENVPFTYLIPANKDYYLPFDFAFVANKNEYNANFSGLKKQVIKEEPDKELIFRILDFINNEVIVRNNGNIYANPILYLKGKGIINLYINGQQILKINLDEIAEDIIIDTQKMEAYNPTTKILKNRMIIGNYEKLKLLVGKNEIKYDGVIEEMKIQNYSRWI